MKKSLASFEKSEYIKKDEKRGKRNKSDSRQRKQSRNIKRQFD